MHRFYKNTKKLFLGFAVALSCGQVEAQNPFSATVITTRGSQSPYATTQNPFATNNCTTGSQNLTGQCTWYVAGRIQELRGNNSVSQNSANTVYNALCSNTGRNANRWHLLIPGNWISTSSSQPLPINQRQPGMVVTWNYGTLGHVAFVEEISADKTRYRISEFNVSPPLAYSERWLSFNSPRVFVAGGSGYYPKFYALEVGVPVPVITSPTANVTMVSTPTTVRWNAIPNAEYRLQISKFATNWTAENGFTSATTTSAAIPVNINTGTSTFLSVSNLEPGTDYYITIRCNIAGRGASKYSAPIKFTTRVAPPVLLAPSENATVPVPVNLSCNNVSGADGYRFQVSTSLSGWTKENGFTASTNPSSGVPVNVHTSVPTFRWSGTTDGVLSAPEGNKTYYLSMRVNVPGKGFSEYSAPRRFTTQIVSSLNISPMSFSNLPAFTSVQNLSVTAIGGLSTITSTPNWVTASQVSSIGIANIRLSVQENPNNTARSGFVVVRLGGIERRIPISQEAGYLNPSISSLQNVAPTASTRTISVSSSSTYTATSNVSWITCRVNGSAIIVNISGNATTSLRNGTITLRQGNITKLITVSQLKRANLVADGGNANSSIQNGDEAIAVTEKEKVVQDDVMRFKKVEVSEKISFIQLYPNPAMGENITLKIQSEIDRNVIFEIVSLDGKKALVLKQSLFKGENNIQMNITDLQNGFYLIRNDFDSEILKFEVIR